MRGRRRRPPLEERLRLLLGLALLLPMVRDVAAAPAEGTDAALGAAVVAAIASAAAVLVRLASDAADDELGAALDAPPPRRGGRGVRG